MRDGFSPQPTMTPSLRPILWRGTSIAKSGTISVRSEVSSPALKTERPPELYGQARGVSSASIAHKESKLHSNAPFVDSGVLFRPELLQIRNLIPAS